ASARPGRGAGGVLAGERAARPLAALDGRPPALRAAGVRRSDGERESAKERKLEGNEKESAPGIGDERVDPADRLGADSTPLESFRDLPPFALSRSQLPSPEGHLVIFLDEIDAVRSLPFRTDEFFAGIRECYNRRSQDPEFNRLTFCLLGVASPSELI